MKKFIARWFRSTSGRYLSSKESDNSVMMIEAEDLESAIEIAKEKESEDSSIIFTDRVLVSLV